MDIEKLGDIIAHNLETLLEEKGLAETRLSVDAGLGRTVVRDIIKRRTKHPAYATLVKIANAAGVHVNRIIIGPNYQSLAKEDQDMLELLHQLNDDERQMILSVARERAAARRK